MVIMAKDGVMPSVMFSRNRMKRVVCVKLSKIVNIFEGYVCILNVVSGLIVTMAKEGVMPSVMFSRNRMKRVVFVKMRKIVNILKDMGVCLMSFSYW